METVASILSPRNMQEKYKVLVYSEQTNFQRSVSVFLKEIIWNLDCQVHNSTAVYACSKQGLLLAGGLCTHANDNMCVTLEKVVCDRTVSVLIKKTLFSFCLHVENNNVSLLVSSCVSVPVSRFCHP